MKTYSSEHCLTFNGPHGFIIPEDRTLRNAYVELKTNVLRISLIDMNIDPVIEMEETCSDMADRPRIFRTFILYLITLNFQILVISRISLIDLGDLKSHYFV